MAADSEYSWTTHGPNPSGAYLWPALIAAIRKHAKPGSRLFDLGSGNGATARMLLRHGYDVIGVDPSGSGLAHSSGLDIHKGSAYDDLASIYGHFPVVYSLEVIEHCMWPRRFARTVFDLIEPGGVAIISTPFHGYWKNLAIAISGKFDAHVDPLFDGGHIKFFSERTLTALLTEAGFNRIEIQRAGRIAPFAKSMIAIAHGR